MITRKLKAIAKKYLSGTASEEEKKTLHDWYDRAQGEESDLLIVSGESREEVKQRIFRRLRSDMFPESGRERRPGIRKIWLRGLAAAFVLLFAIWMGASTIFRSNRGDWLVVEVPSGEVKELLLPDGSLVWINAGSILRYPKRFGKKERRVELQEGQAFFEIKPDQGRAFFVESGSMKVSVLGTSFDVKSYASESIAKVSVRSGLVGVDYDESGNKASLKLQPGQQAVIDREKKAMRKEAFDTESAAAWREGKLVFENELVPHVFNALERRYNITIDSLPEKLLHESISIKLGDQSLEDVMEVLKYTLDFNYEFMGDKTVKFKE